MVIFALYIVMTVGAYVQAKQTARPTGGEFGIDYRILYTAGQTALAGDADQIYDSPSQNARILQDTGLEIPEDNHWLYPPTLLLTLVSALSVLPFRVSYLVWLAATLVLAVLGCAAMLPKRKSLSLVALSFPAVMYNFSWGQNGFLSTALLAAGIGFMETSPVLSGLMFGLLTYKTWLAVFPFLILLVTRNWKVLGWSALFTGLTLLLSLAIYGSETWQAFFHQLFTTGTALFDANWWIIADIQPSLMMALRVMGINGVPLYVIITLVSIAATVVIARIFRNTNRVALRGSAMVLGIFVVIPYFIEYDLMLLSIPTILLIYDCMQEGAGKTDAAVIVVLWLMPMVNLILVSATRIQISPFVAMVLLIYVFLRAKRSGLCTPDSNRVAQDDLSSAQPQKSSMNTQ